MSPRRRHSAPVPSEVYTEEYFRTAEAGFHRWETSGGTEFGGFYQAAFDILAPKAGDRVLDLGTGRGEVPIMAAERGATGLGIDYAQASMDLSAVTFGARGRPAGAYYARADGMRMPFRDATFDLTYAMDYVEHLLPDELDRSLTEVVRVLKPGGALVIHTMPNRLMYDLTYPIFRTAARATGRGRAWPREPRHAFELQMHVNEMRRGELARVLRRAGFAETKVWLGPFWSGHFLPSEKAKKLLGRMAHVKPLRLFASCEIWATARAG